MVCPIVHVEAEDVEQHPQPHKGIDLGLKFQQDVDVHRLPAQLEFIDEVALCLLVVIGDKRLVQRLAFGKIQLLHPGFGNEGLNQLPEDRAVGEQLFVPRIMDLRLGFRAHLGFHTS